MALNNGFVLRVVPCDGTADRVRVGKTTLAYILASALKRPFYSLSAINSGVKDIREKGQPSLDGDLLSGQPAGIPRAVKLFVMRQDKLRGIVEEFEIPQHFVPVLGVSPHRDPLVVVEL